MKKTVVFALVILVTVSGIVAAQNLPSITIVNNTGKTIRYLHVVVPDGGVMFIDDDGDGGWGEDLLPGKDMLANGGTFNVQLPYPLNSINSYNIKLVGDGGPIYVKWGVKVTNGMRVVFTASDAEDYRGPTITIVNNTGYKIYYLYISPRYSSSWGYDQMGSTEELANGASKSIKLPVHTDMNDTYDIRIEDSDGDSYSKRNVKVSQGSRIVFTMSDMD